MEIRKRSQIVVAAAVCAIFGSLSLVGWYKDKLFFASPPYPRLLNTSFENYTVVQIDSFNTSMAALFIVDMAFRDAVNSSKIVIKRRMLNPDRDELYISELQLLVPANITATNPFDTSQLTPDYAKIEVGARPLIAPAFAIGSLRPDVDAQSDVLVIGLGGSQMNNYLHYKFPKMNITIAELEATVVEMARKYFGLQEDKTQRVFVMNGLHLLQKAAREGRKFDAVYLDACPTSHPHDVEILCPVSVFLEDNTIDLMREVLKETGSLVLKVLLNSFEVDEQAEKLADIYRKHFANCAVLELMLAQNRVIVCGREGVPKEHYEMAALAANTTKFYKSVGLMDEECCFHGVNECCTVY
uniref:PABS domain-containing protein n=1 Tax=Ascaris lumbricoides TaxID=6252 RepID=A0A0M3I962_ASCLU